MAAGGQARRQGKPARNERMRVKEPPARKYHFFSREGQMDLTFLILTLLLLVIGLVMLFSSSYALAYFYEGDSFHYIAKQVLFAVMGVAAMLFISTVDYHVLQKFSYLILAVGIGLLMVVAAIKLATSPNKPLRWIYIGSFQFQPSEIVKFGVVVAFANYIARNYQRMKTLKYGVLPFLAVLGFISGLMMIQPHLSGTVLILLIGAVIMFVGGVDIKWFGIGLAVAAVGLGIVVLIPGVIDYAMVRIEHWQNPFIDPLGDGFQTIQSLYAISSGGILGVGIGNSRQKYLYLPEAQNDFIFAIACEELGFIGAALIVALFAIFVWRGFVIAARAKDRFGTIVAVGLTAQVGLQALLNIAVVTNTIPNTGISLPFFSYGGTSLVMLLAQMGVVLSISRQSSLEKE